MSDNVEFLYCNFFFKFILIVLVLLGSFGNILIVLEILVGIFIIFLWILNCFFLGVCISFWNVSFGVKSLYFSLLRLKKFGFIGNCILFRRVIDGILFFIK